MRYPRFGVWAVVNGSWASFHHPDDPVDASWRRNKALIVDAEKLGFETTLVAQQTINPWSDEYDQLEAWAASAALAEATSRIEIITAIKPALYHPAVLAKQALQIHEISEGRFAINLVNGWFKPELERGGIPFLEHDERYDYGREWISVVRRLISGERVHYEGRYFQLRGYQLRPGPWRGTAPRIYLGGESEAARNLAVDVADTWFINGRPVADTQALIEDLARRPRTEKPVTYALAGFVIARETDGEADEALREALLLSEKDANELRSLAENSDAAAVTKQVHRRYGPRVGTNGGTIAGLVGSYNLVAERLLAFHAIGIDTFMLQFQPFEAEMRRFAAEVIPRVRHRIAKG